MRKIPLPTQKRIRELFIYDHALGLLRWRLQKSFSVDINTVAGSSDPIYYTQIKIDRRLYTAHRLIYKYFNPSFDESLDVDHIDNNPRNNHIENLQLLTTQANTCKSKRRSDNKSGVTGISWSKDNNKFRVSLQKDKKKIHIGYFLSLSDAIKFRDKAYSKYGFHKNHGVA
jgi:hypothetical protein